MKKHELNATQKKAYRELFVNRDNAYQRQNIGGIPYHVASPLSDEVLFDPNENVGAYQLNNNNQIKYAALDIDLAKSIWDRPDFAVNAWLPMLQEQTSIAHDLLQSKGIDSLIEFSGFKGYHVWIFFDQPVSAGPIRTLLHSLFDTMDKADDNIEWEIFPKQDCLSIDENGKLGFGNYIKPPLQIHKKSGNWSYFVDENFKEIDVDLTNVPKTNIAQLEIPQHKSQPRKYSKPDYSVPPPNMDNMFAKCELLQKILEKANNDALTGQIGHENRLTLASLLKPFGEKGYQKLTEILNNCTDYDEQTTRKHWDSLDRAPITCEKCCGTNICDKIIAAKGKSPIKFAYEIMASLPMCFTEKGNCYFKKERKQDKQISTFIISPRELLVLEDSDCLLCDVTSAMGYNYQGILLENVDWHTKARFLKAIGHQDCTFIGSENDLQALCSYVNNKTPMRKVGTKVIGLIDDTWVIDGYNIDRSGINNELLIIPFDKGSDAFYHRIKYQELTDSEYHDLLRAFYNDIGIVNDPEVIYPMIGWLFTTPLKSIIMAMLDGYPMIFVHGGQGSGKTTTGRLLLRIAGYVEDKPNSCTMRPFPMLKLLSANNGIPVLLDEFKVSDMKGDQVDSLLRFMRKSYYSEVEQKGHADQTVEDYQLLAPIIVMGEWSINQPALKERLLLIRFSNIVKQNVAMQQAYDRLRNLPLEGFMPRYIKFCMGQNLDALILEANEILNDNFQRISLAPRIRNNLIVMTVGLLLFKLFANENGILVPNIDIRSLLNSQLKNITGSASGNVKSAVDQLIEELGIMASNDEITLDHDYKFTMENNNEYLAIAFNKIFPAFKEYARRTNYEGEILDKESFTSLFKECDYIPVIGKVKKFYNDKTARCIIIDVKKANAAGLSLDGFK